MGVSAATVYPAKDARQRVVRFDNPDGTVEYMVNGVEVPFEQGQLAEREWKRAERRENRRKFTRAEQIAAEFRKDFELRMLVEKLLSPWTDSE